MCPSSGLEPLEAQRLPFAGRLLPIPRLFPDLHPKHNQARTIPLELRGNWEQLLTPFTYCDEAEYIRE